VSPPEEKSAAHPSARAESKQAEAKQNEAKRTEAKYAEAKHSHGPESKLLERESRLVADLVDFMSSHAMSASIEACLKDLEPAFEDPCEMVAAGSTEEFSLKHTEAFQKYRGHVDAHLEEFCRARGVAPREVFNACATAARRMRQSASSAAAGEGGVSALPPQPWEEDFVYVSMFMASFDFCVFADMMRARTRTSCASDEPAWSWGNITFNTDSGSVSNDAGMTFAWDVASSVAGLGK
jgi:hypothetical protein